jgi:hypothetical protein
MDNDLEPVIQATQAVPVPAVEEMHGDFRGPYGFGRPAHKPDPSATYVFRPHMTRVLPVKERTRWR